MRERMDMAEPDHSQESGCGRVIMIPAHRAEKAILNAASIAAIEGLVAGANHPPHPPCPGAIQIGFARDEGTIWATATTGYAVWDDGGFGLRRLGQMDEACRKAAGYALAACLDDEKTLRLARDWLGSLPPARGGHVHADAFCTDRSVLLWCRDYEVDDGKVSQDRLLEVFRRDLSAGIALFLRPGLSAHQELAEISRMTPLVDHLIEGTIQDVLECGGLDEDQSEELSSDSWVIRLGATL